MKAVSSRDVPGMKFRDRWIRLTGSVDKKRNFGCNGREKGLGYRVIVYRGIVFRLPSISPTPVFDFHEKRNTYLSGHWTASDMATSDVIGIARKFIFMKFPIFDILRYAFTVHKNREVACV